MDWSSWGPAGHDDLTRRPARTVPDVPATPGTVVEDVRIVDSPLRPEPVLEVRVRPRAGALRCSRCGRRRRGYDQGGGVRR